MALADDPAAAAVPAAWWQPRPPTWPGAEHAMQGAMQPAAGAQPSDGAALAEPLQNGLLAALAVREWAAWRSALERVEMPLGSVLYEACGTPTHVFFPTTAIVSLMCLMQDGSTSEVAAVGHEGMVGIAVFMGGTSMPSRAVVRSAGIGYRMRAEVIQATFKRSAPVMRLLLRYTQTVITQMTQTAVCNRHHTLDQQLCRWLLLSLDRLHGSDLEVTQERIAASLGVRREGVTEAAGKLQAAGVIRYARGHIRVLSHTGLMQRSCECYRVVRQESERLLPKV